MSLNELLIIGIGLVAGWLLVSKVMAASAHPRDDLPAGDWHDVLGVPRDASPPQIDAAYERKCRELEKRDARIATMPEQEQAARRRAVVDAAYQRGKRLNGT